MLDYLQIFDSMTFSEIPEQRGIYSFFFDYRALHRALPPADQLTEEACAARMAKIFRAHTLSNPREPVVVNISGRSHSNSSGLLLRGSHQLRLESLEGKTGHEYLALSSLLSKCSLLMAPMYVGITTEQTFAQRFDQHMKDYKLELATRRPTHFPAGALKRWTQKQIEDWNRYDSSGKFGERLARRGLEFRDLIFVCVSVQDDEVLREMRTAEKIIQAVANPPLSTSN